MALRTLLYAGLATSASAVKILIGGYGPTGSNPNGTVTTLEFTSEGNTGSLKKLFDNTDAGPQPTWIDLGLPGKAIVLDEAWNTPATSGLHTFTINKDGSLTHTAGQTIKPGGPVSTQFYGKNKFLAIAHYGGSGISTFKVNADASFTSSEIISYLNRTDVGPVKPNQDVSHVHHSVIDPTGQYIVFPDLGLDVTHVFCADPTTGKLTEHAELRAPAGYGPRHAAFWKSGDNTYLFITHELTNKIISYKVNYVRSGGLTFKKVDEVSTYGPSPVAAGGAAAEISVSPDSKFVLASNRNVTLQQVPNVDPANSTTIASDSISTFKPSSDGKLAFVQLAPSGGKFPRHFSLNKDGSLLGVANQQSGNFRIYKRDLKTGKVGNQIAAYGPFASTGGVNQVRWLE